MADQHIKKCLTFSSTSQTVKNWAELTIPTLSTLTYPKFMQIVNNVKYWLRFMVMQLTTPNLVRHLKMFLTISPSVSIQILCKNGIRYVCDNSAIL